MRTRVDNRFVQTPADAPQIIAPCGLNCSLCRAYKRVRNPCPGCRGGDRNKSPTGLACAIKNCEARVARGDRFCSGCEAYPCAPLSRLEARYRKKYGVNVFGNLERIETVGVVQFLAEEAVRWTCARCGARLCMHEPQCPGCGHTIAAS